MARKNYRKVLEFCVLAFVFMHFLAPAVYGGEQNRESSSSPIQFTIMDHPIVGAAVRCDDSPPPDSTSTSPLPPRGGGDQEDFINLIPSAFDARCGRAPRIH
jgi:hypothetical protein